MPMTLGALVALSLASCKGDEPDSGNNNGGQTPEGGLNSTKVENYIEGESETDYLQNTAIKFLEYFDANDQKALIQLATYFSEELSYYEFPETDYDYSRAKKATRNMMRTFATNEYLGFTRDIYTYTISIAPFKGVYEPDSRKEEWVYVANSNDFVLRFVDDNNKKCEITVSCSGDTWKHEVEDYGDIYIIEIPKTSTLTITRGGETLVNTTVKSDYKQNSSFYADVEGKVMNLTVKATTNGSNSEIKETSYFGVNGERIASSEAIITGNNMCNLNSWESTYDRYEDDAEVMARMINGATGKLSILDQVFINSKIVNVRNFVEYLDFWADDYDYDDPEREAKNAANKMKGAVEATMTFAGSNKERAVLGWEPYLEYEGYNYNEWCIRPVFTFNSDGSSYDFESYFGDHNFFRVENMWKNIINKYVACF